MQQGKCRIAASALLPERFRAQMKGDEMQDGSKGMSIIRALDQFFGTLELAQKYARLYRLDDASLAARGHTREGLAEAYVAEFDALDAAAPAATAPKDGASDRGLSGFRPGPCAARAGAIA